MTEVVGGDVPSPKTYYEYGVFSDNKPNKPTMLTQSEEEADREVKLVNHYRECHRLEGRLTKKRRTVIVGEWIIPVVTTEGEIES